MIRCAGGCSLDSIWGTAKCPSKVSRRTCGLGRRPGGTDAGGPGGPRPHCACSTAETGRGEAVARSKRGGWRAQLRCRGTRWPCSAGLQTWLARDPRPPAGRRDRPPRPPVDGADAMSDLRPNRRSLSSGGGPASRSESLRLRGLRPLALWFGRQSSIAQALAAAPSAECPFNAVRRVTGVGHAVWCGPRRVTPPDAGHGWGLCRLMWSQALVTGRSSRSAASAHSSALPCKRGL